MESGIPHIDVSIILPADNQSDNLALLLPEIHSGLTALSLGYEIIVTVFEPSDEMRRITERHQAHLVSPSARGYGAALGAGLSEARGDYIVTMDPDQEHAARLLEDLWQARDIAEVIIASRYVPGGGAIMPPIRRMLSRILNMIFSRGLDLRIQDMSSGFRLYRARVIKGLRLTSKNYDVLQEILVRCLMEGYEIREVPFEYHSSEYHITRLLRLGFAYLKTFAHLWQTRNSIASADYDARAYDALMPPQRYWQRKRFHHITTLLLGQGRCLDVGCGSSRIISSLPPNSVALDISFQKLRFARYYGRSNLQGSISNLPIASGSFPCVICSQVIEHVARSNVLDELDRVLEPGGLLILGTPDYSKWQWILIEWLYGVLLPQAYADEHITHYTYQELTDEFVRKRSYRLEAVRYILQGELILGLRKPLTPGS